MVWQEKQHANACIENRTAGRRRLKKNRVAYVPDWATSCGRSTAQWFGRKRSADVSAKNDPPNPNTILVIESVLADEPGAGPCWTGS
jgi:hypothetical protein